METWTQWNWRPTSINPPNNRDLNQCVLHLHPNLVVLAPISDDLLRSQAQNGQILTFWVKFDLEVVKKIFKCLNTLRPRQNGYYFTDNIFKCIIVNENVLIWLKISLNFVPKARINNIAALVQIMAWRRPADKPLSEQMMVRSATHICVTRPQWVKNELLILWTSTQE